MVQKHNLKVLCAERVERVENLLEQRHSNTFAVHIQTKQDIYNP